MKKLSLVFVLIATLFASSIFVGFTFDPAVSDPFTFQLKRNVKTISFLGDSITYGYKSEKSYTEYLSELLNYNGNNYGISSTQVSDSGNNWKSKQSFVYRYDEIADNSDVIFVWGGSNDWSHCATLGEMGDTDVSTFYGALDTLFSSLLEEYPDATIVTATCLRRVDLGWGDDFVLVNEDSEYSYTNSNGDTLEDFANAVKEVADKYGISCIDIYNAEECDFTSDTDYTTYWTDGVHPNAYGDEIIAGYLYEELLGILNQ